MTHSKEERNLTILVLAALPQEYAGLERLPFKKISGGPFKRFELSLPGRLVVLVETGMGAANAERALSWSLSAYSPDLLVSIGFAGGLDPSMRVGDVCLGSSLFRMADDARAAHCEFRIGVPAPLERLCAALNIRTTGILTASSPEHKKKFRYDGPEAPSVIDMESAALAHCRGSSLALVCLRAVSDARDDRIGFDLGEISGPDGRVSMGKVLFLALRRPAKIGNFYRLWRRSSKAAKNLGKAAAELLALPLPELGEIVEGARVIRCRRD